MASTDTIPAALTSHTYTMESFAAAETRRDESGSQSAVRMGVEWPGSFVLDP